MFRPLLTKVGLVIASCALLVTACDRDKKEPGASAALGSEESVLRFIPADTPYVVAAVEPFSDEIMDQLEPKLDRILRSYQAILQAVIAGIGEEGEDSDDSRRLAAILQEFRSFLSIDGLRGAGIGRGATGALYGNSLLPILRLQVTDGELFEAAIARIEARAGETMNTAEVAGSSYRYVADDEAKLLVAVIDDQAVFTIVPVAFDADLIATALGLTLPKQNIAASGVLQEIAGKYGYTDNVVGFIDFRAFVEPFLGEPKDMDSQLLAQGDYDPSMISDACRAEIRELTGVMPRMVFGYTSVSAARFDSNVVLELREDIAAGLQALPAAVPGLGADRGAGLMAFGMSLDAGATRSFLEARLEAFEADPPECEYFADLQDSVASARQALNQPVPPIFYDFRGFLAVIDNLEGLDVATQTPPTSVDGTFLLAMENAPALVSMGTMFSPELAALGLEPDGDPVALELPQLQSMGISAYAALSEKAVAVSIGENAEAEVAAAISAESGSPPPFMSFSMDAARYYSFMGEAVAVSDATGDDAPTPEMKAAVNETMQAVADLYERMSGEVFFTSNGVEISMTETLKD